MRRSGRVCLAILVAILGGLTTPDALAQGVRPVPGFEVSAGSAAFLGDGDFDHVVAG